MNYRTETALYGGHWRTTSTLDSVSVVNRRGSVRLTPVEERVLCWLSDLEIWGRMIGRPLELVGEVHPGYRPAPNLPSRSRRNRFRHLLAHISWE